MQCFGFRGRKARNGLANQRDGEKIESATDDDERGRVSGDSVTHCAPHAAIQSRSRGLNDTGAGITMA